MTDPVVIDLDREDAAYRPGDTLSATYRCAAEPRGDVNALEVSVLWYTEGKGDEDLGVHHFERLGGTEDGPLDVAASRRLSVRLPNSPLSYDGVLIKIRWCVRVRVFLPGGKEWLGEAPFRLGEVARAMKDSP
ncbi:MAG TPA: hypothetical protein VJ739_08320 [Gemmataceae bacterium]|nr:hypothetical protein [Gemmataceae bacterium]